MASHLKTHLGELRSLVAVSKVSQKTGEKKKKREENTPGSPGALTQKIPQHCSPSCPSNVLVVPLFPTRYSGEWCHVPAGFLRMDFRKIPLAARNFWEKTAIFGQHFDSWTSTEWLMYQLMPGWTYVNSRDKWQDIKKWQISHKSSSFPVWEGKVMGQARSVGAAGLPHNEKIE